MQLVIEFLGQAPRVVEGRHVFRTHENEKLLVRRNLWQADERIGDSVSSRLYRNHLVDIIVGKLNGLPGPQRRSAGRESNRNMDCILVQPKRAFVAVVRRVGLSKVEHKKPPFESADHHGTFEP